MSTPPITKSLMEQIEELPESQQYQVLSYIQSLKKAPVEGVPGKNITQFAGSISSEDIDAIEKAIEEDCERIDINEW